MVKSLSIKMPKLIITHISIFLTLTGSEYGIVLLSTVRSKPINALAGGNADIGWIRSNLGFVADEHRICVGITRCQFGLVIVGM